MATYIKIGEMLHTEFEFMIEELIDSLKHEDNLIDILDIPTLESNRVEFTKTAYNMVQETEEIIRNYGLNNYRNIWNEIKDFYIQCGAAEVFDREAYNRGEIAHSNGLKGLIWFKHKGIEYTFNKHPKFEFQGKVYDYHKHPVS